MGGAVSHHKHLASSFTSDRQGQGGAFPEDQPKMSKKQAEMHPNQSKTSITQISMPPGGFVIAPDVSPIPSPPTWVIRPHMQARLGK